MQSGMIIFNSGRATPMKASRIQLISFLFITALVSGCNEEIDERDLVAGKYYGTCINQHWDGGPIYYDTVPSSMILTKSADNDSFMDLLVSASGRYSFLYRDGSFIGQSGIQHTHLSVTNNSLSFGSHVGLGPGGTSCHGIKER